MILSVMCPYKKVYTRKESVPWLTPEIYNALRDKRLSIKKYKQSKCIDDLKAAKVLRNKANMLIEKAKRSFIKNSLRINNRNPKKFWRIINDMIKEGSTTNIENITFLNQECGEEILKAEVPDFLNRYFANIVDHTRLFDDSTIPVFDQNIPRDDMFEFMPPSIFEIRDLTKHVDTGMSSCIEGINASTCKALLESIRDKFVKLFANSMFTGIFPKKWACAKLTFLQKDGNN